VNALRLCLGTLTALPVPAPHSVDRRTAGRAMLLAPFVGLVLGLAAAAVTTLPAPPLVDGVLAVALLAALTRGLHLDGLADTADGLGSGRPAADALEVMRRSDIGPFGVVSLVLCLGLQAASVAALVSRPRGWVLVVVAVVLSRTVLPALSHGVKAARADGLGRAVADSVGGPALLVCVLPVLALCLVAGATYDVEVAVAGTVGALVVAALFTLHCVRRLGGLTGDVLGACVEVTSTAALVIFSFH
jgi:adenosylcobinamide-GDP ribazoletransferase